MKERIALISLFVNLILTFGKVIVGFLSRSTSVLADGIHSGTDVVSSLVGFIGIRIAKKPVDKKHPYGHYKFEVLSGLVITILLFIAGVWMIYEAYEGFLNPLVSSISYLALGVMLFSAVLNAIMSKVKIYYGKKENSLTLLSDGVHDRADVLTSIAVFIGLLIMPYWNYIDSVLAFLIGLYIIRESFSLGREATDSLLDVSAGEEVEDKINEIAKKEGIKVSDIKTQKKGSIVTANLEIELPSKISVEEATKLSNNFKENLISAIEPLEYIAVQIKGHDVTDSYFEPKELFSLGKGFGWQRRGKFKDTIVEAQGRGPEGYCVCKKCGYKIEHKRGVPCSTIKCPKCNLALSRG
jgi:cation diffusion facilitator family transporter